MCCVKSVQKGLYLLFDVLYQNGPGWWSMNPEENAAFSHPSKNNLQYHLKFLIIQGFGSTTKQWQSNLVLKMLVTYFTADLAHKQTFIT